MKIPSVVIIAILFQTFASVGSCEDAVALVIGNGAYDQKALRNPVNDATAIAASLERIGYDVILETDRTRRSMKEALRAFRSKLKEGGTAVFYFAGHGVQVDGSNYLLPVDADLRKPFEVPDESVNVGLVLRLMRFARTKLNVVILDCCRENPFARGEGTAGLAAQPGPANTLIAFATAPGRIALDGNSDHSPYTDALLSHIENPKLSISDLFQTVAKEVGEKTNNFQRPWKSDDFSQDFFLARSRPAKTDVPPDAGKLVIGFSPAPRSRRGYRQKIEFSGMYGLRDRSRVPFYLSITQEMTARVQSVDKLTGNRKFQVSASEIEIRIEITSEGKLTKVLWNSKEQGMPLPIRNYLEPAGEAIVKRILAKSYSFMVNQFGKIEGAGLGLDEVIGDSAADLGVTVEELRNHAIKSGIAYRLGPSLLFIASETFPLKPVQIGDKWLDSQGSELKLISHNEGVIRIAATTRPGQKKVHKNVNSFSGFVEIDDESGFLQRLNFRVRSDFGGEMKDGHFTIFIERTD